uniref:Uncharacterized protein n=1 Tax=Chromera velia CCMP2878 TaxID=1169474 RepID=A0A0G4FWX0_9ALVE|eukprot:Cvel_3801.t1-p1 / transcript=Cvel_3801.t1 / gene=Cvel_3801 / organism=Chromera_velia_CCMP2878 / gene_product=hypothetical protein / transcript_product=hypothetical protein / location=Cvel_scaffold160:426-4830(-) / protein_length=892 / sequence_SO=supercontig / SO=protein_coding / is_pseudo=false
MFVARYFEQKRAEKAAKELDLDVVPSERVGSKLNKWLLTRPTREEVIERGILIDREQRNAVAQSLEIFFGRQLATDRESREEGRRYNATADLPSSSAPPLEEGNTQLPLPSTAVPPFPYSSRLKEFLESSKLIDLPSLTKAKKKLREANERLQQTQTDLDANQASFPRQAKRANIEILSLFQSVAHHEASLRSIEDRLHGSELLSAEERMKELTALLQKMQKLIGEKRYLLRVQKMYMQSAGVQAKMFRDPSGALEDLDAFFCSLKSLEGGACSRLAGERLLFVCNYLRPFFVDGLHQCLKSMGWGMLTEVSKSCGVRAELEEREELPETILQLEDRTVFFAGALDLLEECYRGGLQMTCAEGRRGGENEVANRKESASAADAGKRDCRFEREKEGGGSKFSWIESTLCARIIETFRFQMLRAESSACRPDKPEFAFKYMEELHKQHATRLSFLAPLSEVEGEEEERRGGIEGAENEKFLKDLNICERRGLEVFRRAKSTDACIAGPLCLELRFFLRGLFRTLVDERSARLWIERANGNEKEKEDSDSHHAKKGGGMEMMQNQLLPESCREGGGGALSLSERHRLVLHLIQVVVEAKAYWVEADPASAAEITADFDENTRLWGGVEEERGGQRETSSAAEGGQSEGVKKKTSKGGTTEGKKEKEGEPVDGWDVDLDDLEIEEEEEEEEEEGGGGGGEGKREEDKEGGGETRNENDVAEEEKSAPVGLLDLFVSLDLLMVHRSLNASSKPASSFWMPLSVGVEGGGPFVGRLGRQVIELLTVATARTSLLTSDGAIDLYCQTVLLFILRKAAAALKEKWNALTDPGGKADREGAALAVETARVLSDYLVAELNCAPWLTEVRVTCCESFSFSTARRRVARFGGGENLAKKEIH